MKSVRLLYLGPIFILASCGGQAVGTVTGSSDSGTPAEPIAEGKGPSDAGRINAACPATLPTEQGCTAEGATCEYGNDRNPWCNDLRVCSGGRWASPIGGHCDRTAGEAASCTHAPEPGAACVVRATTTCDGENASCGCVDPTLNGPDLRDASTQPIWTCVARSHGCPYPRARVGSACAAPGTTCDYGACAPNGFSLVCGTDGYWGATDSSCPRGGNAP